MATSQPGDRGASIRRHAKVAKTGGAKTRSAKTSAAQKAASGRRVVNMRIPEAALVRIDRAALVSDRSRTDFMVQAAEAAATDVLMDQTEFRLSGPDFDALLSALDAPAEAPKALVALLQTPAPWEG